MSIKKNQIANQVVSNSVIPLPIPANPEKWICVQMMIPDSIGHRAAFLGAISNLATWRVWQRDTGHNGTIVAQLWQIARRSIHFVDCNPNPVPDGTLIEVEEMSIHVDCDCNVTVDCPEGGTKQLVTTDMINQPNQPGGGTPQPQPSGGQHCYPFVLDAAKKWFIPVPINTGDVIQVGLPGTALSGSANDGTDTLLYCGNGASYNAGSCSSAGAHTVVTDPLNTKPHMSLLLVIAGVYYEIADTTFTVPGGIVNQTGYLQENTNNLAICSGSIAGNVCYTNNVPATFQHVFNFVANDGGFTMDTNCPGDIEAVYVPGSGWKQSAPTCQPTDNYLYISRLCSHAVTVTSILIGYTVAGGGGGLTQNEVYVNATLYGTVPGALGTYNQLITSTVAGVNSLSIRFESNAPASTINLIGITVKGLGADPF